MPVPTRPWTPDEDALLGSMPDADVAKKLNRPALQIKKLRRELNAPAFDPRHGSISSQRTVCARKRVQQVNPSVVRRGQVAFGCNSNKLVAWNYASGHRQYA